MTIHPAKATLRRLLTAAAAAALLSGCLPGGGGGGDDRDRRDEMPQPPAAGEIERAVCGDGRVQADEACDWRAPDASRACAEVAPRFVAGAAGCTDECTFDLSACELGGECGNGEVEPGEHCDDGNLDDQDGCSSACTHEGQDGYGDDIRHGGGSGLAAVPDVCAASELDAQPAPDRPKQIRVALHVVREGDKISSSDARVRAWLEDSNALLASARIELVQAGAIDVIESTRDRSFFNLTHLNFDRLIATNNQPDAIDVYFVNSQTGRSGKAAGGMAPDVGGNETLDGVTVVNNNSRGTLAHEIGHILGLPHTFQRPGDQWSDDACRGDGFCDTAADPGPSSASFEGGPSCVDNSRQEGCDCSPGNSNCAPACSDGSRPDPRNVMSYYRCGDDLAHGGFSVQQIKRMHCLIRNSMSHARADSPCTDRDGDGYSANIDDACPKQGRDCNDLNPLVSPEGIEACNTLDDDCDGEVDEDTAELRGAEGAGRCQACLAACVDGEIQECDGQDPQPEICNGEDDDCDGRIDEDVDPLREAVPNRCPSRGICRDARQICDDGAWRCELPIGYMAEECPTQTADQVCGHGALNDPSCDDGVDNDCDGVRDEHNPVRLCLDLPNGGEIGQECFASPHGRCGASGGVYQCLELGEGCGVGLDCVGATFPEPERCDEADWDCDGDTHDRGDLDGDGYGDCDVRFDCDESDPDVHSGARELCDGVDNDCDRVTDEGFGRFTCGQGICRRTYDTCSGGRLRQCDEALRRQGARGEVCNGLDDDCDGQTDEGGVCNTTVQFPALQAIVSEPTAGDREFAGHGPDMLIRGRFIPQGGTLTAELCVEARESGGDTRGVRCVRNTQHLGGTVQLQGPLVWALNYHDTDHNRDWPRAEPHRVPGVHWIDSNHVRDISCMGDRRGNDLCADPNACTGCRVDFNPITVTVRP